jgi:hypothetical protein
MLRRPAALRCVSKHDGTCSGSSSSFETRARAFAFAATFPHARSSLDEDERRIMHSSRCQTATLVPAARFCARGFAPLLRSPQSRGGRSAERRSGACEAPVLRAMTRHARRLRGALRPMTRDARLSALHRGGFRLPGPRFLFRHLRRISELPQPDAWLAGSRASRGERLRAAAAGRHASLRLQDRL